ELLGDEEVLNNINQVDTEPIDISSLADNSEVTAILKVPNNTTIVSGINQIKVKITFSNKNTNNNETPNQNQSSQGTQGTIVTKDIEVPISFENIPDGYEATSDISKVKLKLSALESDINNIKIEKFICNADLTNMIEGEHMVSLSVTNPYENVKIVEDNPKEINVKIMKKAT
ncbi:MAG: CdaR family protein, partial [Sarcina sp.]